MIAGVGIDIIEIGRIKRAIERAAFIKRVFTVQEQMYCESRGAQRGASYAARFAGKEAVFKAFGTGLSAGSWQEVEILNNGSGQPQVELSGFFGNMARERAISEIFISLTHARESAAAQVVLWRGNKNESINNS